MYQTFKKTLSLLSKQEKKRGLLVLMMVIIMAVFETLGVASIMPFLTVLGNPEAIETNPYLNTIYSYFNFQSKQQFLIALGVFAFSLVVFSAAFRIATTYVINRYTQMRLHTLSERLLETYLRQPYSFFLGRNTGDMAKSILSEVNQLISNVLKPAMDGIAYIFVTIALISFLIINDPKLALIVGATIGGSYLVIFLMIQKYIKKLGFSTAYC
ncbi:ABC transporter transmembrane domain-containing protein [Methylophaga muralis]|uniref:ABC transporter transmembrane region n=1 Tax=Methylophaga muralis TaxID=291169 RepID=A0A1E3GPM8_9GAMM|nr:ABC transporter transmembrane domain-containing protein [Methylophaga muralis]ODN65526.1 ABC transporter transmembrane region [Methylophaga muralis]